MEIMTIVALCLVVLLAGGIAVNRYSWEEWSTIAYTRESGFLFDLTSNGFKIWSDNSWSAGGMADWAQGCTYHYIAIG